MKQKKYSLPLFLLLVMVWLGATLVSAVTADSDEFDGCLTAPGEGSRGKVIITIPTGETAAAVNEPIALCPGMNVQASGGSMLSTPIVINAIVHQDYLILTAHLIDPQPGPVDVTVWWQLN